MHPSENTWKVSCSLDCTYRWIILRESLTITIFWKTNCQIIVSNFIFVCPYYIIIFIKINLLWQKFGLTVSFWRFPACVSEFAMKDLNWDSRSICTFVLRQKKHNHHHYFSNSFHLVGHKININRRKLEVHQTLKFMQYFVALIV